MKPYEEISFFTKENMIGLFIGVFAVMGLLISNPQPRSLEEMVFFAMAIIGGGLFCS